MERDRLEDRPRIHLDEIIVRPAQVGDADLIGRLWEHLVAYHHHLDRFLPAAAPDGGQLYAQRIAEQISDNYAHVVVAEYQGTVIGFALGLIVDYMPRLFEDDTLGFLADIYLEPDYRGLGAGRRLVAAVQTWLRSRGVTHMEWHVAARNSQGRAFWQALGGEDLIVRMRVDL